MKKASTRSSKADRLRSYFDNQGWTQSMTRPSTCTINKVSKWNGVPVDMRPFSRFDRTNQLVVGTGEPQTLILGEIDRMNRPVNLSLSEPQSVIDNAIRDSNKNGVPLLLKDESYERYVTKPAVVQYKTIPKSVALSEGVMTPAERRERLEFEVKSAQGRVIERSAAGEKNRRIETMRNRFPNGVLGVDGPSNPDTVVYAASGAAAAALTKKQQRIFETRRTRLNTAAGSRTSSQKLGYNVLAPPPFTNDARAQTAGVTSSTSCDENRRRIWNDSKIPWSESRAQNLRNNEQAGRPYNILSGARISYLPPTVSESVIPRQAHPSLSIHGYVKR